MGGGRLPLLYLTISLISIIVFFAVAAGGILPSDMQSALSPLDAVGFLGLLVSTTAFIHALTGMSIRNRKARAFSLVRRVAHCVDSITGHGVRHSNGKCISGSP